MIAAEDRRGAEGAFPAERRVRTHVADPASLWTVTTADSLYLFANEPAARAFSLLLLNDDRPSVVEEQPLYGSLHGLAALMEREALCV